MGISGSGPLILPAFHNKKLLSKLHAYGNTVYQTNFSGGFDNCMSRQAAYQHYRGFLGPECS